jgi:LacI family transcriptional regulator
MDVAARAGVSFKTVSRVVNNEAHVRPALREKVLKAVEELGYRPNLAARQLAGNRSFLISLVMIDIPNSYSSQIVMAAAAECRRFGYHLVSETVPEDETGEDVVRRVLANSRPDGIILPPPMCNEEHIVAAIKSSGTPLVRMAGTGDTYGHAVSVHERDVSERLVRHLIELGHRRIALIAPPDNHGAAHERVLGYRDALESAGIVHDPDLVRTGDFSFASGATIAETMLSSAHRPTAIFASNDGMALGVLAQASKMGLQVPGDIAIAGFDDSPSSRMVFPPLTTVRQPIQAMARAAVLTLLGEEIPSEPFEHELILRGSTTGDRELVLTALDA